MSEPKPDKITPILYNIGISAFIVVIFLVLIVFFGSFPMDWAKSVNDFADVLAGFFVPITIVFLILNYREQKKTLDEAVAENLRNNIRAEFSSMAPIYIDILNNNLKYTHEKFIIDLTNNVKKDLLGYQNREIDFDSAKIFIDNERAVLITFTYGKAEYNNEILFRAIAYYEAYVSLISLHSEAFLGKKIDDTVQVLNYNGPFSGTDFGLSGRRLCFYVKRHDILKKISSGELFLSE